MPRPDERTAAAAHRAPDTARRAHSHASGRRHSSHQHKATQHHTIATQRTARRGRITQGERQNVRTHTTDTFTETRWRASTQPRTTHGPPSQGHNLGWQHLSLSPHRDLHTLWLGRRIPIVFGRGNAKCGNYPS